MVEKTRNVYIAIGCIACPIVLALITNDSFDLALNHLPSPVLLRALFAFTATIGILSLCKRFMESNKGERAKSKLLWIGRNTLSIYLLHGFLIGCACRLIEPHITTKLFYKPLEMVFVITTLYLCVRLTNAKARWMVGK